MISLSAPPSLSLFPISASREGGGKGGGEGEIYRLLKCAVMMALRLCAKSTTREFVPRHLYHFNRAWNSRADRSDQNSPLLAALLTQNDFSKNYDYGSPAFEPGKKVELPITGVHKLFAIFFILMGAHWQYRNLVDQPITHPSSSPSSPSSSSFFAFFNDKRKAKRRISNPLPTQHSALLHDSFGFFFSDTHGLFGMA